MKQYPEQVEVRSKFINFIEEYEDCFDRENEYGHFTGSGWLVNKQGDKVLLTHHRKLNMWLQPGGHCDGESDVAKVALTEAVEETAANEAEPAATEVRVSTTEVCVAAQVEETTAETIAETTASEITGLETTATVMGATDALVNNDSAAV